MTADLGHVAFVRSNWQQSESILYIRIGEWYNARKNGLKQVGKSDDKIDVIKSYEGNNSQIYGKCIAG